MSTTILPGDLIVTPWFAGPRLHRVTAVVLGATRQESVVELVAADGYGNMQPLAMPWEMLVAGIGAGAFSHYRQVV